MNVVDDIPLPPDSRSLRKLKESKLEPKGTVLGKVGNNKKKTISFTLKRGPLKSVTGPTVGENVPGSKVSFSLSSKSKKASSAVLAVFTKEQEEDEEEEKSNDKSSDGASQETAEEQPILVVEPCELSSVDKLQNSLKAMDVKKKFPDAEWYPDEVPSRSSVKPKLGFLSFMKAEKPERISDLLPKEPLLPPKQEVKNEKKEDRPDANPRGFVHRTKDGKGGKVEENSDTKQPQERNIASYLIEKAKLDTGKPADVPRELTSIGHEEAAIVEGPKTTITVLKEDGEMEVQWPVQHLKYTSVAPPLSYSCNPKFFGKDIASVNQEMKESENQVESLIDKEEANKVDKHAGSKICDHKKESEQSVSEDVEGQEKLKTTSSDPGEKQLKRVVRKEGFEESSKPKKKHKEKDKEETNQNNKNVDVHNTDKSKEGKEVEKHEPDKECKAKKSRPKHIVHSKDKCKTDEGHSEKTNRSDRKEKETKKSSKDHEHNKPDSKHSDGKKTDSSSKDRGQNTSVSGISKDNKYAEESHHGKTKLKQKSHKSSSHQHLDKEGGDDKKLTKKESYKASSSEDDYEDEDEDYDDNHDSHKRSKKEHSKHKKDADSRRRESCHREEDDGVKKSREHQKHSRRHSDSGSSDEYTTDSSDYSTSDYSSEYSTETSSYDSEEDSDGSQQYDSDDSHSRSHKKSSRSRRSRSRSHCRSYHRSRRSRGHSSRSRSRERRKRHRSRSDDHSSRKRAHHSRDSESRSRSRHRTESPEDMTADSEPNFMDTADESIAEKRVVSGFLKRDHRSVLSPEQRQTQLIMARLRRKLIEGGADSSTDISKLTLEKKHPSLVASLTDIPLPLDVKFAEVEKRGPALPAVVVKQEKSIPTTSGLGPDADTKPIAHQPVKAIVKQEHGDAGETPPEVSSTAETDEKVIIKEDPVQGPQLPPPPPPPKCSTTVSSTTITTTLAAASSTTSPSPEQLPSVKDLNTVPPPPPPPQQHHPVRPPPLVRPCVLPPPPPPPPPARASFPRFSREAPPSLPILQLPPEMTAPPVYDDIPPPPPPPKPKKPKVLTNVKKDPALQPPPPPPPAKKRSEFKEESPPPPPPPKERKRKRRHQTESPPPPPPPKSPPPPPPPPKKKMQAAEEEASFLIPPEQAEQYRLLQQQAQLHAQKQQMKLNPALAAKMEAQLQAQQAEEAARTAAATAAANRTVEAEMPQPRLISSPMSAGLIPVSGTPIMVSQSGGIIFQPGQPIPPGFIPMSQGTMIPVSQAPIYVSQAQMSQMMHSAAGGGLLPTPIMTSTHSHPPGLMLPIPQHGSLSLIPAGAHLAATGLPHAVPVGSQLHLAPMPVRIAAPQPYFSPMSASALALGAPVLVRVPVQRLITRPQL